MNNKLSVFVGIDPGLNGAIGIISSSGRFLEVWDMPTESRRKREAVSAAQLAHRLDGLLQWAKVEFVMLEQVSSMPKQGIASAFNFGESFGIPQGVIAAKGLPFDLVPAATWKRAAGLTGKDKDFSRTVAQRMFPECTMLTRKKDVDRAEALLLAATGRDLKGGKTAP